MTSTTKLNPPELLSQLAESDSSGCLELSEGQAVWQIYLQQGKLKYVNCSVQSIDRLQYYLHHFGWTEATAALKQFPPSSIRDKSPTQSLYELVIGWLLAEKHLNLTQVAKLLEDIVKDEIQLCLRLDRYRCNSSWHSGTSVPDWIPSLIKSSLALDVAECLQEQQAKLQQWQNCSEKLGSVHQRPYFAPTWEQKDLPPGSLDRKTLQELSKVLRGRTSIRQLSLLLKKDELQVAQILSPYIDAKIIYLHHAPQPLSELPDIPQSPTSADSSLRNSSVNTAKKPAKTWKIICIDDSPTILSEIKRFLDKDKFEVTAIDNPVQAVSKIFQIEPDLILLDITMPRINGYKLCGLLRSSGKCDDTPIIMVTGNTGIIDKARAKLSGATDYFTKPFTKEGLMQVVEKHLH